MPRTTRNSQDAVPLPSARGASLSQSDRQDLIRDVVAAVLAVTAPSTPLDVPPQASESIPSAQPGLQPPVADSEHAPATQELPGMWPVQAVPSFMNTFTLPSTSVAALSSVTASLASATQPSASNLSSWPHVSSTSPIPPAPMVYSSLPHGLPVVDKPFIIGPGCSPIPAKLVAQIVSGQYIELGDLIASHSVTREQEPQIFVDGRVVFTSTPKRQHRSIDDIVSWIEAFTIYSLVLAAHFPQRWPDLSTYKMLILRTYRQFQGRAWLQYDRAFREHAAASSLTDWSLLNGQLYSFYTAASAARPCRDTDMARGGAQDPSEKRIICTSWNNGSCIVRPGTCRFAHKCLACFGMHRAVNCSVTQPPAGSKRRAQAPPAGGPPSYRP